MALEKLATATFWGAELIFALLTIYSFCSDPKQIGLGILAIGFFVAFAYVGIKLKE